MVSKNKLSIVLGIVCALFLLLWFSDVLPKQVAISSAEKYMNEQLYGELYDAEYAEYSPAHDSYFVYFSGGPNPSGEMGTTRHIGVYYRYFPFSVWYDSMFPG